VTKQSDEHLTIEQRSAFLDKQLSSQEQAIVDAHLRDCQQCQQALADLRQTVALLRTLPQVEVPRSFTLPARIAAVQEQPAHIDPVVTPISQRKRARQNSVQRAVRVVSTLAAVLGLIFILSSFVTALPHGGSASSTASSGTVNRASPGANTHTNQSPTARAGTQPGGVGSPAVLPSKTPTPTPTPMPTHAVRQGTQTSTGPPGQPAPAVLDLSGPTGHLVIGSALLVLAILGFALARRR
jgi:anti-sigma factor RsiW